MENIKIYYGSCQLEEILREAEVEFEKKTFDFTENLSLSFI